jgi:Family of unknown function (DUF6920)
MTRRAKAFWFTSAIVAGIAIAVPVAASWRWAADTHSLERRLASAPASNAGPFTVEAVSQLPPPVRRYFQHVMRDGQRRIVRVTAVQSAEFFINGAWKPLRATQQFATAPIGFVWDARIQMAPLVSAFVRDAYVDGEGSMYATVRALYPLVNQRGRRELDAGALQRFLGEAVWFPTALLPGEGVSWEALSDSAAVATISDAETSVSLEFRFNHRDEIIEVPGDRFAEQDGHYQLRPWLVRCGNYQERQRLLIPVDCEVSWVTPDGRAPYWRGHVEHISYQLAKYKPGV